MKILVDGHDVIVAKAKNIEVIEEGYFVVDTIYPKYLTLHETDQPAQVQKNKFVDGQVIKNEDYVKPQDESLQEILSKISTAEEVFNEINSSKVTLEELKQLKINVLKENCTAAIHAGFKSETIGKSFGFKDYDQTNFTQQLLLIVASGGKYEVPIQWKTLEGGIVTLDVEEFNTLVGEAEQHKRDKQITYWALEAQVLAAETKAQVLEINW